MKVSHILPYLPPKIGGRELWIRWMSPELVRRGIDLSIFASNVKDYHKYSWRSEYERWPVRDNKPVRVYRAATLYNNDRYSTPLVIPQFLKLIKERPDIVHLHEPNLAITTTLGIFAKIFFGSKMVLHCHSDAFRWKGLPRYLVPAMSLYQLLYRFKLWLADAVLAVSEEYVKSSPALMAVKEKVIVFPMSLAPTFRPLTSSANTSLRNKLKIPENKKIVLYVGRIDPRKGLDYLTDALLSLPNAFLIIVGSGDHDSTNALKSKIADNRLSERSLLVPTVMQEELNKYYNIADVLCLPTNDITETFGVVLIEAWAVKKPVVVTDIPAPKRMVEGCGGGIVARRMDAKDIADKLRTILNDPESARRMGEQGHDYVIKNFSFQKLADRLVDIYSSILKEKR